MNVLVIGGTGVISRSIVSELLKENYEVSILNRGRSTLRFDGDVEWITQDRHDHEGFVSSLEGRKFDAVIDMVSFNKEDARQTVEVCGKATEHLIICSTVAAYTRPYRSVPTVEESEELTDDPGFAYAYNKAEMERYLMEVGANRGLPITRIRPSLTFGDGARNVGVLRENMGAVERIRAGKPLVMFGDGLTPWSFSFAPDVARGIVSLIGKEAAFGEAFHVSSEQRSLWRDLYLEMGAIVGKTPELVYIPSKYLYEAMPDLCAHLYREKSFPGLFDNGKLRSVVPGFSARISLREGLESLVESWERDGLAGDPEKDVLADRLIATTQEFTARLSAG